MQEAAPSVLTKGPCTRLVRNPGVPAGPRRIRGVWDAVELRDGRMAPQKSPAPFLPDQAGPPAPFPSQPYPLILVPSSCPSPQCASILACLLSVPRD